MSLPMNTAEAATGAIRPNAATDAQASRESQLVRHWVKARSARWGFPR